MISLHGGAGKGAGRWRAIATPGTRSTTIPITGMTTRVDAPGHSMDWSATGLGPVLATAGSPRRPTMATTAVFARVEDPLELIDRVVREPTGLPSAQEDSATTVGHTVHLPRRARIRPARAGRARSCRSVLPMGGKTARLNVTFNASWRGSPGGLSGWTPYPPAARPQRPATSHDVGTVERLERSMSMRGNPVIGLGMTRTLPPIPSAPYQAGGRTRVPSRVHSGASSCPRSCSLLDELGLLSHRSVLVASQPSRALWIRGQSGADQIG